VKSLFVLVAILFVGLIVPALVRLLSRVRERGAEWPFSFKRPLTRGEQVLFFRLCQTLPELVVLARVPLSSFLRVRKGNTWAEWHDRISRKNVDFLVCERDFSIVMAVELVDGGQDAPERIRADRVKSRALTAAGIRLVRWRTNDLPDVATIRGIVDDIRDDGSDQRESLVARVEPPLHISRIEASNDPSIFQAENR
jgi:very-short-patch-repair endonuclease